MAIVHGLTLGALPPLLARLGQDGACADLAKRYPQG